MKNLTNAIKNCFKFFATVALVVPFFSAPVAALEAGDRVMTVSPSEQVIELTPGESYEGNVKVTNAGRLAFSLSLEVTPYHVNDDSYDPDFSTDNSYTTLKNWVSFPEEDYIVQPGETAAVKFVVNVPKDAPSGGQYAAIMIENSLLPEDAEKQPASMIEVQPRTAAVLYAHVEGGEIHESAELVDHGLPGFAVGNNVMVSAAVKNDGNVDFYVHHTLSVANFFTGREVIPPVVGGINQPFDATMIVLPGTTRTSFLNWDLKSTDTFPIGLYRLTQTVTYLDHEETFERLLFVCPVWFVVLIGCVLFLGIMWLVLSLTKRSRDKRQKESF